jgi:hypothetical protein
MNSDTGRYLQLLLLQKNNKELFNHQLLLAG